VLLHVTLLTLRFHIIFGVSVFSVSASEGVTIEEEFAPTFWRFPNRWLDTLTDDQLATLEKMICGKLEDVFTKIGWRLKRLTGC
jgi:hypothetical protein